MSEIAVLPIFILVKRAGLFLQQLELVVLGLFLGFELLSQSLKHVVLLNDLDPLQVGVDVWLGDAQFSHDGDCRLTLAKLVFIVCVVLSMHVDRSNNLLHLVVLQEQLCGLDCSAA